MVIVNPKKRFPKRPCALKRCSRIFTPKVEHQIYCRTSHGVLACQERKFHRTLEAALKERLTMMIAAGEIVVVKKDGSGADAETPPPA